VFIIFDSETTGLPDNYQADVTDVDNWPRIVQLSWQVYTVKGELFKENNFLIKPVGFEIPFNATKIHKITHDYAVNNGTDLQSVLNIFSEDIKNVLFFVGHNIEFDIKVISCEFFRVGLPLNNFNKKIIDTKKESVNFCAIKLKENSVRYKWPTLSELYNKLFNDHNIIFHNSLYDVIATARCFFKLIMIGIISIKKLGIDSNYLLDIKNNYNNQKFFKNLLLNNNNLINASIQPKIVISEVNDQDIVLKSNILNYSHIHNHTLFSILNSTISVETLINRSCEYNMPAVGITDYGNMMGAFNFLNYIKYNNLNIKGVVGCELFISNNYLQKKFNKNHSDILYNQVCLAKNQRGYYNLIRLCSLGYLKGLYKGIPRVGLDSMLLYKEDIIVLSGDLNAHIPYNLLNKGEKHAEKIFLWWRESFKDNFYVELLRHGLEEERYVNEVLLFFAKKYNVRYIIQNNNFYLNKLDSKAHDVLLCIKHGQKLSSPIGMGRGYRVGLPNDQFYFKSKQDMNKLFYDLPESFDNLMYLINEIDVYNLEKKVTLPKFNIPIKYKNVLDNTDNGQRGENKYLEYLTLKGAKEKYNTIDNSISNRIKEELDIISRTQYPGYFLIIRDIILNAKKMNVFVGPGRGSVAGSIVAYCIGITNVDPIKYNLLFERFLNVERMSLPDIDIDFDDKGRDKIIDFVVNKYGYEHVAQIITYSTMGAKSSIRDAGRVLNLSLYETDYIAKLVPNNITLNQILSKDISYFKYILNNSDIENILEIQSMFNSKQGLKYKVIKYARIIEGSIRGTGVHACGIIITPYNIKEVIPVCISKDSNLIITQFDNSIVEKVGLLKMDFLGLKTLTILKETIKNIYYGNKRLKVDINSIPLDNVATYKLFQQGNTIAIFQYESLGMQKYLQDLKPDSFHDLIAMNALYRPGPMKYIPNFISRKHGKEIIKYDLYEMQNFLQDTYGITVYQEQVMLLSQKLADFSKSDADILRVAMGKKQKQVLDNMKNKFIINATSKGYDINIVKKIWIDWEKFALYAFNKSHATCYALIAFQAAYLKSHYPCEYMAAVLSNNMDNIKNITFFIDECKRMNIPVLHPDVNESNKDFTVNSKNQIRFGLVAIKGIGQTAVDCIIKERDANGLYRNIYDFIGRMDLRVVNKKILEGLIYSGSFDAFQDIHRYQYFIEVDNEIFLQKLIKYANKLKLVRSNLENSIFNNSDYTQFINKPIPPQSIDCNTEHILLKEKNVIGIYLTSHPLDKYVDEVKYFVNCSIQNLSNIDKTDNNIYSICGIVIDCAIKRSLKFSKKYVYFILEDFSTSRYFYLFGDNFVKFQKLIYINSLLWLQVKIASYKLNSQNFSIINILPLNNVIQYVCKYMILYIKIIDLNQDLIHRLKKLFSNYVGDKYINIILLDNSRHEVLNLKKHHVDINSDLVHILKNDFELNYKLI
jgi:DNA polymerase-3 subunit alpha